MSVVPAAATTSTAMSVSKVSFMSDGPMLPPGRGPAPLLFDVLAAVNGVPSGVLWSTPVHELAPTTALVVPDMLTTMSWVALSGATSDQSWVRGPAAFVAWERGTAVSD